MHADRDSRGREGGGSTRVALGLAGAVAMGLAVRLLPLAGVFPEAGVVRLGLDDSAYHARRALYSFEHFPGVLRFDPYIAYPDGAVVPMPPLYDWGLGAVARLAGDSLHAFEATVAWAGVGFALLTIVTVYALGRSLAGRGAGVGAAWLLALWPASTMISSIGNLDHHAAVSLLATGWLLSSIREIRRPPRRRALHAALHALWIAAMLLVWSGSLLYLMVGEGARLLVAGVFWSRRARLWAQSASALLAAGLVAPWLAAAPEPVGGPFTATTLSWLHVLVLAALALLAAALAWREGAQSQPRWERRALRAAVIAALLALPLLALPELRGAFTTGAEFVAGRDAWASSNPEQQPLFAPASADPGHRAVSRFGWLGYAVPALPLLAALGLRRRERRECGAVLLVWTTVLTGLALGQVRHADELAPLAAVIFAGSLAALHARAARRIPPRVAAAGVVALAAGLLSPVFSEAHIPRARHTLWELGEGAARARSVSPKESEIRFAELVREATPETSGFLDPGGRPAYGVLVHPTFGHSFVYFARRPVPANNFGPYLDARKLADARLFYSTPDAAEALGALERLGTRYVATAAADFDAPMPFAQRLHRGDSVRGGVSVCEPCLRLVTEGPKRGRPSPLMFPEPPRRGFVPYKLFERVAGARVEVAARPGAAVHVDLEIETPTGRHFRFEAGARAGDDGRAVLRLPYATQARHPVRAQGPYRVGVDGGAVRTLEVPEALVSEGGSVSLGAS